MRVTNIARAAVAAALIAIGLLAGSGMASASTDWTSNGGPSTDWTSNPDSVRITGDIAY